MWFFFFSLRGLLAETGSLTLMMLNEHHRGTAMHVYFSVFHVAANLRHCWMIMNGQRCVESDWVMNINAEVLLSTFQKIKKGEKRRYCVSEDNSQCCIALDEEILNQRGSGHQHGLDVTDVSLCQCKVFITKWYNYIIHSIVQMHFTARNALLYTYFKLSMLQCNYTSKCWVILEHVLLTIGLRFGFLG